MAEKRFNIVFSGKLAEGCRPAEVLGNLRGVLGLEEAQVRELFRPGAGAIIRKDLDSHSAHVWQKKLLDTGVICTLQEIEPPHAESQTEPRIEPPRPSEIPAPSSQARPQQRQQPLNPKPDRQPPPVPQRQASSIFPTLFKLMVVAAIVGGGWWVYQNWFAPPTPAFIAYTTFSEDMVREHYQKAADESKGEAKAYAESRVQMMKPAPMKVYGKEFSMAAPSVSSIAGDVAWIKNKRISENKKSDSVVELQVEQTVCRIPPGVSSAVCKWPVTFQHDVSVELVDGSWMVSSFKETRLTPENK